MRSSPRGGGFRFRDRYGAPYNTEFKLTVENLSSRASWQVRVPTLDTLVLCVM